MLLCLFMFVGCMTLDRQSGGKASVEGKHSKADVTQAENAKSPAKLGYQEDGVTIPTNVGDELNIEVKTEPNGNVTKKIEFKPKTKAAEVVISGVNADVDTGNSYEDKLGQLKVFMANSKLIMIVGIGFLVAGGLFAGFLRDIRSGIILAGIGSGMLVLYALLPQLYANYAIILGVGALSIPAVWYLHYKKTERIARASVKAYETLKVKNPELAKEHSKEFKQHIKPTDIDHAKKLK